MTIATDPNSDSLPDSDDDFAKHFEEFATGKAPDPDAPRETDEPDGNGPEGEPPAPADAATETDQPQETATSGDAPPEGGDQPPEGDKAPDP